MQGAWGGGGGGTQPLRRGGGTIGQRRLGEKLGDARNENGQYMSGRDDSGRGGNSNSKTQSSASSPYANAGVGASSSSSSSSKNFVFQQPTNDDFFKKPPEEIAIQDEGLHEISLGPTAPARLRFFPQLFEKKEANWIFEDLLKELPWRQQVNRW